MAPAIVDSTQSHLWTDALHARQLAREAMNRWDRGTYVRMCVTTAWTALEGACQDALGRPRIGQRFKDDLDEAVADAGLAPLDWSSGVWQAVRGVQEYRKDIVHRILAISSMFPAVEVAEDAIATVRLAAREIYRLASRHAGASYDDPTCVRIYLVIDGEERLTTVLPPASDPAPEITTLLSAVNVPISGIRVYERGELTLDYIVNVRGS